MLASPFGFGPLTTPRPAHVPGLMLSIDDLRPYYTAIKNDIFPALNEMAGSKNDRPGLRFERRYINPDRCRTPEHLILETIALGEDGNTQLLEALHTPFGSMRIKLPSTGFADLLLSQQFIDTFDWELTDVTNTVASYDYYQEEDTVRGPSKFLQNYWCAKPTTRLYLVRRVRQTYFASDENTEKPVIFSRIVLKHPEQRLKDAKILDELDKEAENNVTKAT